MEIIGLTPCGRATVVALKLNKESLTRARHRWVLADGTHRQAKAVCRWRGSRGRVDVWGRSPSAPLALPAVGSDFWGMRSRQSVASLYRIVWSKCPRKFKLSNPSIWLSSGRSWQITSMSSTLCPMASIRATVTTLQYSILLAVMIHARRVDTAGS